MGSCFGKEKCDQKTKYSQPQIKFIYKYNNRYYFFHGAEQPHQQRSTPFWMEYM